jgi:hypothetical protein
VTVIAVVKPGTMPIREQIAALQTASKPCVVFGDKDDNEGKGFSLVRTLLAHKTEIDPQSPLYFGLSIRQLLEIKKDEYHINYRLAVVKRKGKKNAMTWKENIDWLIADLTEEDVWNDQYNRGREHTDQLSTHG